MTDESGSQAKMEEETTECTCLMEHSIPKDYAKRHLDKAPLAKFEVSIPALG